MLLCLFTRRKFLNEFTDEENQLLLLQLVTTSEKDPPNQCHLTVDEICDSLREENVNAEMHYHLQLQNSLGIKMTGTVHMHILHNASKVPYHYARFKYMHSSLTQLEDTMF